jgi:hypothetical protein
MAKRTVIQPRNEIAGMPVDLAAAVCRLDDAQAEVAIGNWESTGTAGRRHYRAYISVARTRRSTRKRSEAAARLLLDPYQSRAAAVAGS